MKDDDFQAPELDDDEGWLAVTGVQTTIEMRREYTELMAQGYRLERRPGSQAPPEVARKGDGS